ncbi:NADAR family protein [Clostridium botulinum]|nr:NADAR family protein [Clostridium botulinum]NFL37863.1 NADAR family protein [Clostridium botulinum]NFL64153.1 NADAR family protein [Clostridium botulinum]NFN07715.1 NADAR family protein [Clostridium botulinum]NFN23950.1 NADAR family protein [Clostridium botulinum]
MKCIDEFNDKFKSDDLGKITQFRGEYFFLSSFYICRINYKGIIYNTAEAAFQSMKSKNIEERKEFVYLTPKEAKIKGNEVSLREDWEDIKEAVMYNICLCKFSQNDDLAKRLMETADAYLEQESSWNDKEWGTVDGVGENKLGRILMKVREEIKKDI